MSIKVFTFHFKMKPTMMSLMQLAVKSRFLIAAFFSFFLVLSCGEDKLEPDTMPRDLVLNVSIVGANTSSPNGDGSGRVQVAATATKAVRYAFSMEAGDPIESKSGVIQYEFSQEGIHTYDITAWAYGSQGEYINETVTVEVYKAEANAGAGDGSGEGTGEGGGSGEGEQGLVFSDEFEYEGSPDPEKWHHQVIPIQGSSWANGELQHYTDRQDNSYVSDGTLKIVAAKEQYTAYGSTKAYTSARLNSKFAFKYGRVEFRAKLPQSAGTWPALWTLGANINETGNYFGDQYGNVGWPRCGEVDILEQTGWDKNSTIAHFHWADMITHTYFNEGGYTSVTDASGTFHVYAMEWSADSIKVFVDDTLVHELPNDENKPYNDLHYLLMNIAVGGNLGGDVPANFTQGVLEVDYVRVYQ